MALLNSTQMTNPLQKFSTDSLLEELVRRRNIRDRRDATIPLKHCDECANFATPTEIGPNVWQCGKGHRMTFREPEDGNPNPDTWGFYRRVCKDRTSVSAQIGSYNPR